MLKVPLAIVSALDDETRIICSKMCVDTRIHVRPGLITRGTYDHHPLLLVRTGIGPKSMASTMGHMLAMHRPELIIHTGYCGGADPALQPGDLVIAESVIDSNTGQRHEADKNLVLRANKLIQNTGMRGSVGALVTVDSVVNSPHDKAFLATQHSCIGIDMESAQLAHACSKAAVPYLVVRAVLDPLDYHLPDLTGAIAENGSTDGFALASHLIRKPADVLKLTKIEYFATQAREAITSFVDAWLKEEAR
ncbi:MAG: hypothetical protein ABH871_02800 [Pseudomonadota bacterium]